MRLAYSQTGRVAVLLVLAASLVFALALILAIPSAQAAATYTVSPAALTAASLPVRVTVTASENAFTAGASTPYLMLNGHSQGSISAVSSTATTVAFTVGSGLSNGTYTVRIVTQTGTIDAGTFTVGSPSIQSISPSSVAKNYNEAVTVTVTGQNTNFALGQSSVEILNSLGQAVSGAVGGVTAAASASQLSFTLNTGLATGTYSVRVTTGSEVVTASSALQVRGTPAISISPATVSAGYSSTAITVTGSNTGFSQATTVAVLQNNSSTGKAGTPTVNSTTSLTFSLGTGLSAGIYTVKVATGVEEATATLTVATPSATLQYQGNAFSEVGAGYASSYSLTVAGSNTSFAQGTSSLALFNGSDQDVTATYTSNFSVSNTTAATFSLGTGLPVDTYTVKVTTGQQEVSTSFQVVAPSIQSITFNSAVVSGTSLPLGYAAIQQVDVVGSNSNFQANTTAEVVGQADATSALNVVDATHLSFALEAGLAAGDYTLRVDMDGDAVTTTDRAETGFSVTSPSLVSVTPSSLANGSTPVTITVVGVNTHFTAATPTVDIPVAGSESISSISVISDTRLTFSLTPSEGTLPAGTYGLTITTSSAAINETASGNNLLTVASSGISSISPSTIYTDELGIRQVTVSGSNTSFGDNTVVTIDDIAEDSASVVSATSLQFTVPNGLVVGPHDLAIDQDGDSTDDFTTSFLVSQRAISLASISKTFGYTAFDQTVTGQGVTFSAGYLPTIQVLLGGEVQATPTVQYVDATHVQFAFPTGLNAGSYTVRAAWSSGTYAGVSLDAAVTVNHQISSLYLKKSGQVVNTVTVYSSSGSFDLNAFGVMIASGQNDQDKTSSAVWSTSDSSVATVSNGTVTIVGAGSATITASFDGQTTSAAVNVQSLGVQSLSLSLLSGSDSIVAGQTTATVRVTATMNDSSQQDVTSSVTWTSNPLGALSVSSQGVVSGTTANAGAVSLTAGYNSVNSNSLTFQVSVATTGLSISPSAGLSVTVGSTLTLAANASKSYGAAVNVTPDAVWTSSDNSKATVASGVVTGVAAGTVTITASYGGFEDSETVTVNAASQAGGGGGGGSIVTPAPAPATGAALEITPTLSNGAATAEVDAAVLTQQVQAATDATVAIKVPETAGASEVKVLLPVEAVTALKDGQKNLEIQNQVAPATIPPAVLAAPALQSLLVGGAKLEFAAKLAPTTQSAPVLQQKAAESVAAGSVVELSLNVVKPDGSSEKVASFAGQVWVSLPYDEAKLGGVSPDKLAAYRYNEAAKSWDFVGGKVDTTGRKVQVGLRSFSLYTAMAYNKTFADLSGHWAKDDVELMASRYVVNGTSGNAYAPAQQVTRAEFAALLVRALELTNSSNAVSFADVRTSDWFYEEVSAANAAGLVKGLDNKTFAPMAQITREEMATMVARALKLKGVAVPAAAQVEAVLQAFQDRGSISAWAREGAAMAVQRGVVNGRTPQSFVPASNATRAEAAVMLKRMMQAAGLI